jgi:RNA-binding protein YlmH
MENKDYLLAHMEDLADKVAKTDTVASLRLDAVLCAAFGLSRTKAAELITAGRVNLDYQLCIQPAKELNEGTLLSVRGMGRAKLLEVGGVSKKDGYLLESEYTEDKATITMKTNNMKIFRVEGMNPWMK